MKQSLKSSFILLVLAILLLNFALYDKNKTNKGFEQQTTNKNKTFSVGGVNFTMIFVEGDVFTMGATQEQGNDAESNEKPTHQVNLNSYYIGETEVTQALWEAVMGENTIAIKQTGDNFPICGIPQYSVIKKFLERLNKITGEKFRLPTEEEWEYAARGGNKSKCYKYSGSNSINDIAWFKNNSNRTIHSIKTMKPNELGLYDMSGNVSEWCSNSSPISREGMEVCIVRGGSYLDDAKDCRISKREFRTYGIDVIVGFIGFRLVLDN